MVRVCFAPPPPPQVDPLDDPALQRAAAIDPALLADPYITPFRIVYDNNEGLPWTFSGVVESVNGKRKLVVAEVVKDSLETGDYSIQGMESFFTIERKSLSDFRSTLTAGCKRFEAEHQRMRAMVRRGGMACVVVEASWTQAMEEEPGGKMQLASLRGSAAVWPWRHGVQWFFCDTRRQAEVFAMRLMLSFWDRRKEIGRDGK